MSTTLEPLRSESMLRRMRMARLLSCLFLTQWLSVACVGPAAAADVSEYEVKAAFVLNFTKFVQFPGAQKEGVDLRLCVAGEKSDLQPFQRLSGKLVGSRALSVQMLERAPAAAGCEVLFIAKSSPVPAPALLAVVTKTAVLTVGETEDFLLQGGVVRFFVESGRIRFAIRRSRADAVGISVSSKLLALAVVED